MRNHVWLIAAPLPMSLSCPEGHFSRLKRL